VKSGSTANTAAGGPLDGVTVTILNADKRIGTHVFATVARNDAGPALDRGHSGHSSTRCYGISGFESPTPVNPMPALASAL